MSNSTDGNKPKVLLKLEDVEQMTSLSGSNIYNKMSIKSRYYDPTFPRQVRLGPRSVAWEKSEVEDWIDSRMKMR
ncbi:MAG: AlpA family phage regulatory protein [Pseudomonadota bacterium]|nr:AlpA family phage regulatory protein [Pseudomonadota bacterium]